METLVRTFKSEDKFYPIVQTSIQVIKIMKTPAICNTIEKYVLVPWPEIQDFMEHPRWEECIFCQEIEGHPCPDGAYMVPESLYKEVITNIFNYEV